MDRQRVGVLSQRFHQYCRPSVHKSFGQPRVKGIGELGLHPPCAGRHFVARQHPIGALADIGPRANRGDPALQRVDVAAGAVKLGDARGDKVGAQIAAAKVLPQPRNKARVRINAHLPEIRQRAGFPETPH